MDWLKLKNLISFILILFISSIVNAKQIKIAIIDSGLDYKVNTISLCEPVIDLTKTNTKSEFWGHGNNITHIITDGLNKKDYCIYHIKAFSEKPSSAINAEVQGIAYAISKNVDIINLSEGGINSGIWEEAIVELAILKGIKVIAAAGNERTNLDIICNFFPACYNGVTIISNLNNIQSNFGKRVNFWENGNNITAGNVMLSGTSQATALYVHKLILKMIKENKK